jgi:NAD(P)-dependent dehydrogenase (short-subunit alcohol dehydrogenase family)
VVNNAGYGHFGFLEEITETEARAQIETNVFGALGVTQAAIPLMREQGAGHIVQISSIGGVAAFPGLGIYHASKWALEGFSEALSQEVAPFGIKVTLIEPGGYATDWAGSSATLPPSGLSFAGGPATQSTRTSGSPGCWPCCTPRPTPRSARSRSPSSIPDDERYTWTADRFPPRSTPRPGPRSRTAYTTDRRCRPSIGTSSSPRSRGPETPRPTVPT